MSRKQTPAARTATRTRFVAKRSVLPDNLDSAERRKGALNLVICALIFSQFFFFQILKYSIFIFLKMTSANKTELSFGKRIVNDLVAACVASTLLSPFITAVDVGELPVGCARERNRSRLQNYQQINTLLAFASHTHKRSAQVGVAAALPQIRQPGIEKSKKNPQLPHFLTAWRFVVCVGLQRLLPMRLACRNCDRRSLTDSNESPIRLHWRNRATFASSGRSTRAHMQASFPSVFC